jgi:dTDP-4-dehydrorhamnose reductase
MLRLMAERGEVGVVDDQRGSPTWSYDLASAIADIVRSNNENFGTYHYTNEGEASWYDFASLIAKLGRWTGILAKEATVKPLSTDQFPSKVRRPSYSVLSKDKCKRTLGIVPPMWQDSLRSFITDLEKNGIPTA